MAAHLRLRAPGASVKKREAAEAAAPVAPEPPPPPPPAEVQELSWEDVRPVDVLGLEVGYRLVPLVDRTKGGDLLARIRGVRRKLTQELGFLVPAVHIRDNLDLGPERLSHQARPACRSAKAWCIRIASSPSIRAACSAR